MARVISSVREFVPRGRLQLRQKTTRPKTRLRMKAESMRLLSRNKEENRAFAKDRASKLKKLARMLKENHSGLDRGFKSVAKKFARLSFAYINDCCAGHISTKFFDEGKRVSLEEVKSGQKVYCSNADLEIVLNNSPVSEEFRKDLTRLIERVPFVWGKSGPKLCMISVTSSTDTKGSKRQAAQIMKNNQQFIHALEKVVDKFVKKYGVKHKRKTLT